MSVHARSPLTLLQLPVDVLVLVFSYLDSRNLSRLSETCVDLHSPLAAVCEVLRNRADMRGRLCPVCPVCDIRPHIGCIASPGKLAMLEFRRDNAWGPVAAGPLSSFFVASHNGQSSQQMLVINKADLTALVISCGETPSNVTACRDPHMSWSGCVDIAVDCVFSRYKSQSAASNEASLPTLTATKADMAAAVLSCIETPSIILACGVLSANACANRGVACVWRRLTKHK